MQEVIGHLTQEQFDTATDILTNALRIKQPGEAVQALLIQNVLDPDTVDRLNSTVGEDFPASFWAGGLMMAFLAAVDTVLAQTQGAERKRQYV